MSAGAAYIGICAIGFGVMRVGRVLRFRRRIKRAEVSIRSLRLEANRELQWRPVATDAPNQDLRLRTLDLLKPALAECELTVLGDMIETGGPGEVVTRWFVDREQTTFGYALWQHIPAGRVSYWMFMSRAGDRLIHTRRSLTQSALAAAPFIEREMFGSRAPLREVLARHRARLSGELLKIASVDDMARELAAQRDRIADWRLAQPPGDLLEADLKAIFGAQYRAYAPHLRDKLRDQLPVARVVDTGRA